MNKSSKIYLAGHTGMVGSAITRALIKNGYENLIFRDLHELDLRNQQAVNDFFEKEKPEYVILAAAKVGGIYANNTFRADFIYENLMIEANVVHASYVNKIEKLLFLGSSCIYPKLAPQPLKEEYLLSGFLEETNEPYAIAKITGIKLCEAYRDQYGCNFISAMPTNLYGPNDNYDLMNSHVFPAIIRKAHLAKCLENNDWDTLRNDFKRRPYKGVGISCISDKELLSTLQEIGITKDLQNNVTLELWGTGKPYREFLHTDDVADALLFLLNNYNERQLVNIGCGTDQTIGELSEIMKRIIGFKGNIVFNPSQPDGTPKKLLDVSKINNLGWTAKISIEKGIQMVYEEYMVYK